MVERWLPKPVPAGSIPVFRLEKSYLADTTFFIS